MPTMPDASEMRRLADVLALSPDYAAALDVGSGGGWLADRLLAARPQSRVIATDFAITAMIGSHCRDRVGASAAALPFQSRSIDAVFCCDVLEHLPDGVEREACAELRRVAGRWLVINTPLGEDLGRSTIRCSTCGRLFHSDHHQRVYQLSDLRQRFEVDGWRCVAVRTTGWKLRYLFRMPRRLGAMLHFGWRDRLVCPHCGETRFPLQTWRQRLKSTVTFLNNGLTRPFARVMNRDSEVVILFERSV